MLSSFSFWSDWASSAGHGARSVSRNRARLAQETRKGRGFSTGRVPFRPLCPESYNGFRRSFLDPVMRVKS